MPAFRRSTVEQPNALVGAARRVNLKRRSEVETLRDRPTAEWQTQAWRHYDEIGEIKYAFNYFAAISSRVRLYAGYQEEAADTPGPIGSVGGLSRSLVTAARQEVNKLNQGRGGQPNMIRQLALNILVAGECYLVGVNGSWDVRSTSELVFEQGGRIRLRLNREERTRSSHYLPDDAFVARIWRTHPQFSDDADSSLKGVANPCEELLLLSRIIKTAGQSRLNAGILYVADELRFQAAVDPTGDSTTPDIDPFEEELTLALTEPIMGDSPSEIVPMIIRGPAALAKDAIQKFDLSRGFDETLLVRHEKTLQRVLDGIDLPKDLVQGLANVKYSNAKTISEDLLKAHIEPMMVLICEALTTVFLRPMLQDRGYTADEISKVHVWYDASEVVTRPDRSEDADTGYTRMLVSAATWRRSHGFSEADAPTDEELALRIALSGSVAPSTTLDFLRQVAPDLVAEAEKKAAEAFGDPTMKTSDEKAADQPSLNAPLPVDTEVPPPDTTTPEAPEADPPGGELPPEMETEPFSNRDAHVLALLTQFAAARTSPVVKSRNRKLEQSLDVERRLRDSLATHLNDVILRSLEKAGARTVSKVRGDAELKSLVTGVPLERVFATVPEGRRGEFGLEDDEALIRDAIEKARESFESMVRDAQDQAWKLLGVYEAMKPEQESRIFAAWQWLVSKLVKLTSGWLRKPKTQGSYIDMSTIRHAAAIAGGVADEDVTPMDSGRAVLSAPALDATEWEFDTSYRWVHGLSDNMFEPHVMLDDTVFDSWTSPVLAAPGEDSFPFVSHYYPGDHSGCRCDWLPAVLDPTKVNEPTRGDTTNTPDPIVEKVNV